MKKDQKLSLSFFNPIKFKSISCFNDKIKESKRIFNNTNLYLKKSFSKNKDKKFQKKFRAKIYPRNFFLSLMNLFIIISLMNQIFGLIKLKRELKSRDSFIILKTQILGVQYFISPEYDGDYPDKIFFR